jgi:hypothetical protein
LDAKKHFRDVTDYKLGKEHGQGSEFPQQQDKLPRSVAFATVAGSRFKSNSVKGTTLQAVNPA